MCWRFDGALLATILGPSVPLSCGLGGQKVVFGGRRDQYTTPYLYPRYEEIPPSMRQQHATDKKPVEQPTTPYFIADLDKSEARMDNGTPTQTNEASTRPHHETVAQGIGLRVPRSALLYRCPKCGSWNVDEWKNTTIDRTLTHGSRKAKLHVNPNRACTTCGAHGNRLHSEYRTCIIAQVDASKRKQVKNLQAVAEELNALQDDTGEPATDKDANKAWFAMNKLLKQGKGRKWWGMPFRRWQATMSNRRCA